ncbi:sensor histidine kinase [Leptolyngbya ohadii]|uniref:sensor histidine kinase n=1 Tax=Leptolyngbya ohadii TaxID=1962290 RepID=UPI000B5A1AC5|nr:ATP-binding protein [Leptolyngbya ohadii]
MTQPLQILLIDDNKSDRALIVRELRREFSQFRVQEVIDAQDFEQAIANDNFDAVITDYQLRWSNGLEVLRTVKAHYPQCPVIMFTNTGTEEIAVEALQSGLDDYVLKETSRYIRIPVAIRVALERIQTQQRAALLEIRLQTLLNQVKVGIFRSTSDGTLIESNPAFLELLRVKSITQANELKLLDTRDCYERLVNLSSDPRQEREIQLQRSDGTQFWALLTTTLSQIEGIEVVDGLLEDITERKQAETTLQSLNAELEARVRERTVQLEAANQELAALAHQLQATNEDLEEFAYSISHDLRAPLRTIQGYAQVLLEDVGETLNSEHLRFLQRISVNVEQLNTLITDLLTYSRLRQADIELEPVLLASVLSEVVTQLEPEFQARQIQLQIEESLPTVRANRLILIQVLTNLLSNAIKFVAVGVQPQIQVWAESKGQQTRLWIEDNGIGIPLEQQQAIFSPFTRLHAEEAYPGTGIGLAIVRKGIERMGGRVGVESQPQLGSRFWLELPTVLEE